MGGGAPKRRSLTAVRVWAEPRRICRCCGEAREARGRSPCWEARGRVEQRGQRRQRPPVQLRRRIGHLLREDDVRELRQESLIGAIGTEDILDRVFASFCVGK